MVFGTGDTTATEEERIVPTFVGLIPAQKTTLTADVIQAVQVAKRAVNSLVLSAVASPGGPRGFAFGIRHPLPSF